MAIIDPCPVCWQPVDSVHLATGAHRAHPCGHTVDVTVWPERVQLGSSAPPPLPPRVDDDPAPDPEQAEGVASDG